MTGEQRRKEIIKTLKEAKEPVSGSTLAELLSVSRQVIVTDVTLLRAEGNKIESTNKGYILVTDMRKIRILKVCHRDDQIEDELYTVVDGGGKVIDVFIDHKIYGEIKTDLFLSSRKDVDNFIEQMKAGKISPLKHLTNDYHYHRIVGDTEESLDYIEAELKKKGILQ